MTADDPTMVEGSSKDYSTTVSAEDINHGRRKKILTWHADTKLVGQPKKRSISAKTAADELPTVA